MDEDIVEKLIQTEVQNLPPEFADLKNFFIKPQQVQCETFGGNIITLWNIFEKDGYHIMYSDERTIFGLAFNNIVNTLVYCGGNGTLGNAILAFLEKDAGE